MDESVLFMVSEGQYCKDLASPHLGARSSIKITLLSLDSTGLDKLSIYSEYLINQPKLKIMPQNFQHMILGVYTVHQERHG